MNFLSEKQKQKQTVGKVNLIHIVQVLPHIINLDDFFIYKKLPKISGWTRNCREGGEIK